MDLGVSDRVKPLVEAVRRMVRDDIAPLDMEYHAEVGQHPSGDRFAMTDRQIEILKTLKDKAKGQGLWNFWLTDSQDGYGLSTVEYAYLAEEMGAVSIAPEIFNCNAPDTGNMEVLERYGSEAQRTRWLPDLMAGVSRSAYLMTEPSVASSDATQISLKCERQGEDYVLNGEKYWATGAGDPRCALYIVMVCTDPGAAKHARHSMLLIPSDAAGIETLRPMQVFGQDDAPHGHMHIRFTDVRVPIDAMVLGEGRGFEVAQGRLGPGRIHHCMRAIGRAEYALELMVKRGLTREAFGKPLVELGANYDIIANARIDIEMTRLLCLKAAWMMDHAGVRAAQPWISKVKVQAPLMALQVVDEAMQMHGATGLSQDTPLSRIWADLRTLRLADGPDAVHRRQVARAELRKHTNTSQ
ncbi:acyl-CoA dehydrogenase family protein [Jannaschia sp. CCS1]|uniref:acyl-CoA dehydrogenase family protein n=1 Tax=Jannaschia sp. (strain CCS1) TaxID=290400 RepID=UPI000053DE16|nr:acyl-CoA dehydrogenase family protein [Jannaschia sp. CCS1]ABD55728.1 acyl-CoA dehydrogenase-like protein [Jannaschia sp. CCS1]